MSFWGKIFKASKPGKKSGIALVIAAGATLGAPITLNNEGMELKPYYDSVGVLTWCGGETEIGYKDEFTEEECVALFGIRYGYYSDQTAKFYNEKAHEVLTPEIHAAFVDMSYNVGLNRVKTSTMINKINEAKPVEACDGILRYKYAGGKDCSVRKNNCYGVWTRRVKIHQLCMKGVK